jgi:hypothetical protein
MRPKKVKSEFIRKYKKYGRIRQIQSIDKKVKQETKDFMIYKEHYGIPGGDVGNERKWEDKMHLQSYLLIRCSKIK